jgi:predicted NAD-dependent protein-ADP-ribosyltransferase YbiA (DUF1768 family)
MGGPGIVDGKSHLALDNFYKCRFVIGGKLYTSSEHCYQVYKFKDPKWREEMRSTTLNQPTMAWLQGQTREHELVDNFEDIKSAIMYEANRQKFRQNPDLLKTLLSTGDGHISFRESSTYWNEENSRILMRLRGELG